MRFYVERSGFFCNAWRLGFAVGSPGPLLPEQRLPLPLSPKPSFLVGSGSETHKAQHAILKEPIKKESGLGLKRAGQSSREPSLGLLWSSH